MAWSVDGKLAVFCSERYDARRRDVNNRKIRSYKELVSFISNATVSKDESQYEDFSAEGVKPNLATASLKNASAILGITQFQRRTYEIERVKKYPQLFVRNKALSKKHSSEELSSKRPMVSVYIPSEKVANAKYLAREYAAVKDNAYKASFANASICLGFDRFELYKAWNFLGYILRDLVKDKQEARGWKDSPLGRQAFLDLLASFLQ
eukprot:TRINITY_DN9016_c0_g1_i2.p1 TRINITY_DN9016_c0_g1~~TRINITY_DN9016_c0_g1_i2.p1  ORF type:complete len:208 (+),score=44.04 TRINITY_DN9016_c0_g1_i2:436-1059(+)